MFKFNTTYRPTLESSSPLGLGVEIVKYKRKYKTAEFTAGIPEMVEDDRYIMSAEFEDPNVL